MKRLLTVVFLFYAIPLLAQWSQQVSPIAPSYGTIHFFDSNNGWAFGASGSVKTNNAGANWTNQSTNYGFKKVSVVNQLTAYALVGDKSIYKTTDGGLIWVQCTTPAWAPAVTTLDGIAFVSSTIGYVGGTNGYIFKTINGGNAWSLVSSGGFYVSDLFFLDANNGFASRWGGQWSKTADGGATWSGGVNGANNFYSIFALDANNIFIAGANGTVYKTVNGGTNWTLGSTNTNEILYDVYATSTSTVWASGANGTIIQSTDGANTWAPQASGITQTIKGLFFVNANLGWAVGEGGKILKYTGSGSITVTAPNGGENWLVGSNQNITWSSSNITNVKLEYSIDNGSNWTQIVASTAAGVGTFVWTVPNSITTQALVRITDAADNTITDKSNSVFRIYTKAITVISPNGGEKWISGTTKRIEWNSSNVANVKIEYSSDNGTNWNQIVNSVTASLNFYDWVVPQEPAVNYLVRITDVVDASVSDVSNNKFTVPALKLFTPAGGERWLVNTWQVINWTSVGVQNAVLRYRNSQMAPNTWTNVSWVTANSGLFQWKIPNDVSENTVFQIIDAEEPLLFSESPKFAIVAPMVTLTAPNGGENWLVGSNQNIIWTSSNVANVKIEYSVDNGTNWTQIIASTPAALGTYGWVVPNSPSTNCKVRISDAAEATVNDASNNVFTIYTPTITVTSPNGGENWRIGTSQNITWTSSNVTNVKLEYSIDNGTNWTQIVASTGAGAGTYSWTIPNAPSSNCKVRISDAADGTVNDASNNVFTIYQKTVTVTAPNGGESWLVGSDHNITWTSNNVTNVKLEYTTDNGTNWTQIIASTGAGAGMYSWTIPNAPSSNCKVRISDAADATVNDASNNVFTIYQKTVTVTAPNGGENWLVGSNQNITWTSSGITNVKLEYTIDNGTNWTQIIVSTGAGAGAGTYSWTIPNAPSTNCKVRISDAADATVNDASNNVFTIYQKTVTVTAPNGGENWLVGSSQNITWLSSGVANVKLEYTIDNGTNWTTIIASTPAAPKTYSWTIPNAPSTNCRVRISDAADGTINDLSNGLFSIYFKAITVTSPNGGENWEVGQNKNITWTSNNIDNIKIQYSTNNGLNWITVAASTPAAPGTYSWTIPNTPTTQGLIRISDIADGLVNANDVSNSTFTIPTPVLVVTSPNGGEFLQVGKEYEIKWNTVNVNSVKIYISSNNGGLWTYIGTSNPGMNTFAWRVIDHPSVPPGENYKVKIVDSQNNNNFDISDAAFKICKYNLLSYGNNGLWRAGSTQQITWASQSVDGNTKIELSTDNGSTWRPLVESTATSSGATAIIVPVLSSKQCRLKISVVNHPEINSVSTELITIFGLELTAPIGGEILRAGNSYEIKWNQLSMNSVKLENTIDNGQTWQSIADNVPATANSYSWLVPSTASNVAKIRVSNWEDLMQKDESRNSFSIVVPTISLLSPNGGEVFLGGSIKEISWSASNARKIKLEYTFDNGRNWLIIEDSVAAAPSTYMWNVPALTSSNCKIRATDILNNIIDESDNKFSISLNGITVLSPNGGENWQSNTVHNVTWISSNVTTVKLEFSTNNGTSWNAIPNASSISAELGSFSWTLPNVSSLLCKVRVTSTINSNYSDQSDQTFSISSLVITSPNNGDKWQALTQRNITWTSNNVQNVKLDYSTDNGSNWISIVSNYPASTGSYNWTLPDIHQPNCKIRIVDASNSSIYNEGNGNFSIFKFKVVVISPNGNEVWQAGKTKNIQWNSYDVSHVKIYYSTNLGVNWLPIALGVDASIGNIDWIVPGEARSTNCLVKIQDSNSSFKDSSNNKFTIARLVLTSPNGGETLESDSLRTITWLSDNLANLVIEYTSDGTNWNLITEEKVDLTNKRELTWRVPKISSSNCKVRIKSESHNSVMDVSDNAFSITSLQSISIISPVVGTTWYVNTPQRISWLSKNLTNVKISFSSDGGVTWNLIVGSTPASRGYYDWTPTTPAFECVLKIEGINSKAKVESVKFSVLGVPELSLSSPNGGEIFEGGDVVVILWSSSNLLNVDLQYKTSANGIWETIADDVSARERQYSWTLPKINSSECKVRIVAVDKPELEDLSNNSFTIKSPAITIISPNGGELLPAGSNYQIKWAKNGTIQNISIDYSSNNGVKWNRVATNLDPATKTFTWSVPNVSSSSCLVRIITINNKLMTVIDQSERTFTIYTESQDQLWYVSETGSITEKCFLTDDLGFGLNTVRTGSWSSTEGEHYAQRLEKTTNGGLTWAYAFSEYDFLYNAHMYIAKNSGAVMTISDGANPGSYSFRIRTNDNYYRNALPISSFKPTSAYFLNIETGYLIGSKGSTEGSLIRTSDRGQNWSEITIGNEKLSAVFFLNSDVGWISANKKLYSSGDGFNTWQTKEISQLPGAITSIHFTSSQKGFITSSNVVYRTTDGGNNWIGVGYASGSLRQVNFLNEMDGYAVGDFGTVLQTINGGSLWQVSNLYTTSNLVSVGWTPSGKTYINDENGNLYRIEQRKVSIVFPANSSQFTSGQKIKVTWDCTDNIRTVAIQLKQNGVPLMDDLYYRSTFEFSAQDKMAELNVTLPTGTIEIHLVDKFNKTRVKSVHTITVGNAPGQNWNVLNSPGTVDFQKLHSKSFRTTRDKLYSTTTNGRTWDLIYTSPTVDDSYWNLQKIFFLNPNIGYMVDSKSYSGYIDMTFTLHSINYERLLKTTDGGQTWNEKQKFSHTVRTTYGSDQELIPFVHFRDENNGWIVAKVITSQTDYGDIYGYKWFKTTDGGTTLIDMNAGWYPTKMQFLDQGTGYCIANTKKIYKTTDGGNNWNVVYESSTPIHDIFFLNVNYGFLVGSNGLISKTSNGALSWATQFSGSTESLNSVHAVNEDLVYIAGYKTALKTLNGGSTWKTLFSDFLDNFSKVVCFSSTDVLLFSSSVILSTTTGGEPAQNLKENEPVSKPEVPSQYALSQNYPNPFNPLTQFKYELRDESHVKISVYNILGELVAELVNQIQPSGFKHLQWDGSKYPSGVYLLRMEAESLERKERFIKSAKMLLLK